MRLNEIITALDTLKVYILRHSLV